MDAWIELARGPLFRIALAVLVLGLAYRFGTLLAQVVVTWRRAGDRRLPLAAIGRATASWLIPVRLLRQRPLYGIASVLFHVGIIIVPLFLAGHAVLLASSLGLAWPSLPPALGDTLTLMTLAALAVLIVGRLASATARALTKAADLAILVFLFALVLSGFLGAHPELAPVSARALILGHILLGNLALVLTPMSKIAHCVLYPLTHLVFELAWHFPAASGRHVAVALAKEDEPV